MVNVLQGKGSSIVWYMFYRVKRLVLYGIVLQGKGSSILWYMFYRVKRILLYGKCFTG